MNQKKPAGPPRDYSQRSGFPLPPSRMRGAAADFRVPADMRVPPPLRPWSERAPGAGAGAEPQRARPESTPA
jgi:hypothetical protein